MYHDIARSQQKSPSVDCDLASYRIRWCKEIEEQFEQRQRMTDGIVRKTTPVNDDPDIDFEGGVQELKLKDLIISTSASEK